MKNLKYLFIFVFLFGCVQPKFESVKIVDEYGKTAKINKIIPAFNEEQMLKQKKAFNNNNNTNTKVNKFRQNYNNPDENSDVFNDNSNIITIYSIYCYILLVHCASNALNYMEKVTFYPFIWKKCS